MSTNLDLMRVADLTQEMTASAFRAYYSSSPHTGDLHLAQLTANLGQLADVFGFVLVLRSDYIAEADIRELETALVGLTQSCERFEISASIVMRNLERADLIGKHGKDKIHTEAAETRIAELKAKLSTALEVLK